MTDTSLETILDDLSDQLTELLGIPIPTKDWKVSTERTHGDLALPLGGIAKRLGKTPEMLYPSLRKGVHHPAIEHVSTAHWYLNLTLKREWFFAPATTSSPLIKPAPDKKTIVVEYSSPNIAKEFSVGHLRSTLLGAAISNLYAALGHKVIRINHLGDWGTQFGKLIVAWQRWGKEHELKKDPLKYLQSLYARFHVEAEIDKKMEDEAREWFKKLEEGNHEARGLWKRFKELSEQSFNATYAKLGITPFDFTLGESFYEDKLHDTYEWLEKKNLTHRDPDGSVVIPLEKAGIKTPLIIRKQDGASLYATRDLATIRYRIETYKPDELVYVVGEDQAFYFRQIAAAAGLAGVKVLITHIGFGLVASKDEEGNVQKMSTRRGRVVELEEVFSKAYERARGLVQDREGFSAEESEKVAWAVAIGALKYNDFSRSRTSAVTFDWDTMLSISGASGPYLQYAHTRLASLLKKAPATDAVKTPAELTEREWQLTLLAAQFERTITQAVKMYEPHTLAAYLIGLATAFNAWYAETPIATENDAAKRAARLALARTLKTVLKEGLELLTIEPLERM